MITTNASGIAGGRRSFAAALLVSVSFAAPAMAQASPDQSGQSATEPASGMEDIIVTARKVKESLQSTPVAITAFSQTKLDELGIKRPLDLQYNAPSLQVTRSPSGTGSYAIRGQGQGFGTPPGVLLYFAGVPVVTGTNGGQFGLYDLQSVQVLKGPQGTLFGRTATGGAVLFEPQRPTGKFEASFQVSLGSRNLHEITAAVNVPLIPDVLSVRLAGLVSRQDGYTRSFTTGQLLDNVDNNGARIGVLFTPATWLENYALLQYNETRSMPSAILYRGNTALYTPAAYTTTLTAVCNGAAALSGVAGNAAFVAGCVAQRQQLLADVQASMVASMARYAAGDIRQVGTSSTFNNLNRQYQFIDQTVLRAPGDIGPISKLQLKNIFSLPFGAAIRQGYEVDGLDVKIGDFVQTAQLVPGVCATSGANIGQCSPGASVPLVTPAPTKAYTEEINLSATVFDRLDMLLGYFYSRTENTNAIPSSGFSSFQNTFSPTLTANPNVGYVAYSNSWERGIFVQGTLNLRDLLEGLRLTGGYRWNTNYDKRVSSTTPTGAQTTSELRVNGFNYTISADWQVNRDVLVYLRHGRAYKPGGINPITCTQNAPPCPLTFGPEVVKDVELGVKWDWRLGNLRGRTNAAIYKIDDTDMQRRYAGTVTGLNYLLNSAAGKTKGFELEQNLAYEGLELALRLSHTDPSYTRWWAQAGAAFPCTDPINNSAGNCANYADSEFRDTARWQTNVNVAYNFDLGRAGTVRPSITWYHQSHVNYADVPHTDPNAIEPGYSVVHLRVDWNHVLGTPFRVSGFVRNLTDKVYATARNSVYPTLGIQTVTFAEPRTFGVELAYRFGQ